jgi:hypothetical protein
VGEEGIKGKSARRKPKRNENERRKMSKKNAEDI